MALPPGVEPLHVEDDQGAQDEHPDGAQAWHRPVLYVVAGVIGFLVIAFGISQWSSHSWLSQGAGGSINKSQYRDWEQYAIKVMSRKYKNAEVHDSWPVGPTGIRVEKQKKMWAILPKGEHSPFHFPTKKNWEKFKTDTKQASKITLEINVLSGLESTKKSIQFGWGWVDGKFKHIGIGMDGASNVNQDYRGLDGNYAEIKRYPLDEIDNIRKAWKREAKEHTDAWATVATTHPMNDVAAVAANEILKNLEDVLASVAEAFLNVEPQSVFKFDNLEVVLFQQPLGTQLVFNAADVSKETGGYFIRNNKNSNDKFADTESNLDGKFFAMPWPNPFYSIPAYGKHNLFYDNMPDDTTTPASRRLREDVGHVVLTNLTLP